MGDGCWVLDDGKAFDMYWHSNILEPIYTFEAFSRNWRSSMRCLATRSSS